MVIPREELSSYRRWQFDSFDQKPAPAATPAPPAAAAEEPAAVAPSPPPAPPAAAIERPAAEDIESVRAQARADGYAVGLAEGRAVAAEESRQAAREAARQLDELLGGLKTALDELEQTVAEKLLEVAIEIAAQVVRGQIAAREDALLPVVREAIATLPLHHDQVSLRLNPADAARLRRLLGDELALGGTQIVEDGGVSPGGCRVQAGASEIDASIETRWKRVLEAIGAKPQAWQRP